MKDLTTTTFARPLAINHLCTYNNDNLHTSGSTSTHEVGSTFTLEVAPQIASYAEYSVNYLPYNPPVANVASPSGIITIGGTSFALGPNLPAGETAVMHLKINASQVAMSVNDTILTTCVSGGVVFPLPTTGFGGISTGVYEMPTLVGASWETYVWFTNHSNIALAHDIKIAYVVIGGPQAF